MRKEKFYHRCAGSFLVLCLGLGSVPGGAATAALETDDLLLTAPPRTIQDVTRLLEQYKPDPNAAAEALQAASEAVPTTSDRNTLFEFYWARARAAGKIGRIKQQLEDLRQARDLGEPGSARQVRALRELASAETSGGNLLSAVRYSEEAIRTTPANATGQLTGANQLAAYQYTLIGDFDAARAKLRDLEGVLIVLKRGKNWNNFGLSWQANYERGRAELFRVEGRFLEAEAAYRQALKANAAYAQINPQLAARGLEGPSQDGVLRFGEVLERSLASTLLAQGKTAEAEVVARQAIRHSLERGGRGSVDVGQGIRLLASILAEEGRLDEAAQLARAALETFQSAGAAPESRLLADGRRALAAALVAQGHYGEALQVFEALRQGLGSAPELLAKTGSGDLDWVLARLRTGDAHGAESMAAAMLEWSRQRYGDNGMRTAEVRGFHAMTLAATGKEMAAFQAYQQAIPLLLEQARNDSEAESGTRKRQQRLILILEGYLQLLGRLEMERHPLPKGFDVVAESFRLADIARSSGVQRALTASAARARIEDPALADLARQEQDAQRRVNSLNALLTQLLSAAPDQQLPQVQQKIRNDVDTLRRQREGYKQEIARRFPEYARLVDPQPVTLAEARRSLHPGEVLVAWYFGEEGGQVWAVPAQGPARFAAVPLSRQAMAAEVAKLRRSLDPGVSTIDEIPPFDVATAHRLYQSLLQPVQPAWQGAKVVLAVPHGELGQLPLSVLLTEAVGQPAKGGLAFAGYRDLPWLVKQVAIAQLPSVTSLASLRSLKPGGAERRPFIGFGDPLFSAEQAKLAAAKSGAGLATRGVPLKLRNTPKTSGVDSAELALLPRLPDTNSEIREIGRVLGAEQEDDIYLQARASEQSVFGTNLADRRVVMFATHGLVPGDLNGLNEPALALSAPEVAGGQGDGLLTLDEILGLKLNADWVVLSACNTAAGEGSGAEAISGLGRAFFYAGARALLVSNWPVETVAARLIMTDLFRRQVQTPALAKAEALRQSMLALLGGPGSVDAKTGKAVFSYAHPLFWAPFVVVGD